MPTDVPREKYSAPKFADLFCGIGGMRLAFESVGCRCVFSSDWDPWAQKTYAANFGETPEGDIRQITAEKIPDHDILVGGFPCQPFSISGVSKKNSLGRAHGFEDRTQGTLFFEVARIIRDKQPEAFVLENVKNLLSHDRGRTYAVIRETLEHDLGYTVESDVLDAKAFVPQHRERVFIVGFKRPRHLKWPDLSEGGHTLSDILEDSPDRKYWLSSQLWLYLQGYAKKHQEAGNGFGFGLTKLDGVARTLSARYYKDGSEILVPTAEGENPRRLTPRECARLMGFPDSFKIAVSDTQAYKQFGNSVVVPLAAQVATMVVDALRSEIVTIPKQLPLLLGY